MYKQSISAFISQLLVSKALRSQAKLKRTIYLYIFISISQDSISDFAFLATPFMPDFSRY